MQTEHAPEALQTSSARGPSGLRRLSLAMLATEYIAEDFRGTPDGQGATRPGQVLAAFKAAAPFLGYSPRVVHAIDWLFTFTRPQDWTEGSRPVVWPSAELQRDALSLGPTQAKALNRHLAELGLIVMKDSPNGKRYGRRDRSGRITEAYGFDLSPLFGRLAEFQEVAAKGQAERERMRQLRRRATIARNGLLQILETAAEHGLLDAGWQQLESESTALAQSLRKVERVEEMELGVLGLERRQLAARERLEMQLAATVPVTEKGVDSDPRGPEYRPHNTTTNDLIIPKTVVASEESKPAAAREVPPSDTAEAPQEQGQDTRRTEPARTDAGTVLRLSPGELVRLAPRLAPYLPTSAPAWPDIVNAADWLRHDLGVSQPLWGDACLVMGREQAAIALAIVSAKPASYFTASPGSYFHGMVVRARAGELNLARTIWGLRANPHPAAAAVPRPGRDSGEAMTS